MPSVTLDSNVLISALVFGGEPLRLLQMAQNGEIRLDISDAIFDEFGRVLREKFQWSAEDIAAAQKNIRRFANHISPAETVTAVKADTADDRILECSSAACSDFLVTGDKHLLDIGSFRGTKIIRPSSLAGLLRLSTASKTPNP